MEIWRMTFIFKEDQEELTKKAIQKMLSYKGYIPSEDLNEYQYQTYLQIASLQELERDIIYESTMRKVIRGVLWLTTDFPKVGGSVV